MRIEKLATILGRRIEIIRQPNLAGGASWQARIEGAEIKNGGPLSGAYGRGACPVEALNSYCNLIAGRILVLNAYKTDRVEIRVPRDITSGVEDE